MLKPSQRGHISHIKPKPHSAIWRMQIQPKPQTKWIVLKCISRWIVMNEIQNTYKEIFIFKRNQCIWSLQKPSLGMGKLRKGRLSLSITEILHTQMNAFHPQTIKHFFSKSKHYSGFTQNSRSKACKLAQGHTIQYGIVSSLTLLFQCLPCPIVLPGQCVDRQQAF